MGKNIVFLWGYIVILLRDMVYFITWKMLRDFKGMGNKVIKGKNPVGRPPGTGNGQEIIRQVRVNFNNALIELDTKGKGLTELLVEALQKDVNTTLKTIGQFLPRQHTLDVTANVGISDALARASDLMREAEAQVIDIEAENIDEDNNVTEKNNETKDYYKD